MRNLKFLLVGCFLLALTVSTMAQKLLPASYTFSLDKTSFLTLSDGTSIEGLISNLDMSKGLIKSLVIKDNSGKDHSLRMSEIKELYLPVENNTTSRKFNFLQSASSWDNQHYKQELVARDYLIFEQVPVDMRGKERSMLLQLLNPYYSSRIKVYNDPWAFTPATDENREESAYFVKDGDFPAYKLDKAQYLDYFIALFGECESMIDQKAKAEWRDFGKHVFDYTACKK